MEQLTAIAIIENSKIEVHQKQLLIEAINPFLEIITEWKEKALSIVITDCSQADLIELAKIGKDEITKIGTNVETLRTEKKKFALEYGRVVDAAFKPIKSEIEIIKTHLKTQSTFVEREKKRKEKEIYDSRIDLCAPYREFFPYGFWEQNQIVIMGNEYFELTLQTAKEKYNAAQIEKERIENERIAAENLRLQEIEAQKKEFERLKAENEKLKKEIEKPKAIEFPPLPEIKDSTEKDYWLKVADNYRKMQFQDFGTTLSKTIISRITNLNEKIAVDIETRLG
jgi:hypothetical protein